MLDHGIKNILLFVILFGCSGNTKKNYLEKSKETIGSSEYFNVIKSAEDSLKNWISNKLGYYSYLGVSKNYKLDTLVCFNNKKDKLVSCLLKQQLLKEGTQDDINNFYGVKINNKWFFFSGETVVLPREMYQKDTHTPLSFEKMHEIALKEVYNGYLTEDGEINEAWFDNIFKKSIGCASCKTDEDFDKYYLWLVNNNWKAHPDYTYDPQKENLP